MMNTVSVVKYTLLIRTASTKGGPIVCRARIGQDAPITKHLKDSFFL